MCVPPRDAMVTVLCGLNSLIWRREEPKLQQKSQATRSGVLKFLVSKQWFIVCTEGAWMPLKELGAVLGFREPALPSGSLNCSIWPAFKESAVTPSQWSDPTVCQQ